MNIETVSTTVRHLRTGDVLTGSGKVVTRPPFTSVRCPKGRLHVEYVTPAGRRLSGTWNASTTLTVTRKVA